MTTLEEKFLEEIRSIELIKRDLTAISKVHSKLAKEFAKNFDVWKEENGWMSFVSNKGRGLLYGKNGIQTAEYKTFDQLLSLYEEHLLKSKP